MTPDSDMRKNFNVSQTPKLDSDKEEAFDIVCSLRRQKNGEKFRRLYDEGDISDYGSQSEADEALCSIIAFRTGDDPDMIDEIFRSSAL